MKRKISVLAAILLAIGLTACGIDKESSKFGAQKIGAFSNLRAPNLALSL